MEKNFFKKIIIVLIAGLGVITYSCSEEDILEEDFNVRSLAKRNLSNRMEDLEDEEKPNTEATEKIAAGNHTESENGEYCDFNVNVTWTGGYTSGAHNEMSTITASVNTNYQYVQNIRVRYAYWTAYYKINVEIMYDYYEKVPYYDKDGILYYNIIEHKNLSATLYLNPSVTIIPTQNGYN